MPQTPFHIYHTARLIEASINDHDFTPVFASSYIKIYPFQVAAAAFALKSPLQKGVILCDEAGMGKSHEAMLIITQKWLEGCKNILLCIPNADLLMQWTELLDTYYTIPYISLTNNEMWADSDSTFEQDGIIITTYDFVCEHRSEAENIKWDLTVFEEANALSSVYQEDNKQAKILKSIAESSFKVLLTGTPIEKNIMDLYGMMYFIDETVLPSEQQFLARYLRKPENYHELAQSVSKYCFRTLRRQAKSYAKLPERVLLTYKYKLSENEQNLYDMLYGYVNKPEKIAFPKMDMYDLALRILGLQSSSTAAILQTINGVIKRLEKTDNADEELAFWNKAKALCQSNGTDSKAKEILIFLKKLLPSLKKYGAAKKAIIFTESVETQKMLCNLLNDKYKTVIYNGTKDYTEIKKFKEDAEILISTDNGAKGFDLTQAAVVIHYDLPYNTLKIEQRIDRCHRLGQENDVVSVAFIDKNNFSDVRKLELVNKRILVSDGVFGVSDDILGGFTDNLQDGISYILEKMRTKAEIEEKYVQTLEDKKQENKQALNTAEDILFTTFTKELADKISLSPKYISEKSTELNNALWEVIKYFFEKYNSKNTDCYFEIDDNKRTVTATNYEDLPFLFYYWNGSQNKKYRSLKAYGMSPDFKPHRGRITLTSILGSGALHEVECAEKGTVTLKSSITPCKIALYSVTIKSGAKNVKELPILVGKDDNGKILSNDECAEILKKETADYTADEHTSPHWLKTSSRDYCELDSYVPLDEIIKTQEQSLLPEQAEKIEQLKLSIKAEKNALTREIDILQAKAKSLESERENITGERLKILQLDKQINALNKEAKKKQENQFFSEMELDLKLENQIKELTEGNKVTAKAIREFEIAVSN